MKFKDIPATIIDIRVKCTEAERTTLKPQPVMSVSVALTRPGEFEVRLKDSLVNVRPVNNKDIRRLDNELERGGAMLAQLDDQAKDGSIALQIAFFPGECREMGDLEIGVDESVEQSVEKLTRRKIAGKRLYETLERECCYVHGDQSFFFLIAGPAIDDALKPEPEKPSKATPKKDDETKEDELEEEETEEPVEETSPSSPDGALLKPEPTRKNSFCVTGDTLRFVATETPHPEGKNIFIVTRLTKRKHHPDRALRLAKGKLTFTDWNRAEQIRILAKAQMASLTKDDGSYLKKWDEFGDLEGELLLKRARVVGELQYGDMKANRDGTVTVHIHQALDSALNVLKAGELDEVEVADEIPEYLTNPDLTFEQFVHGIEEDEETKNFFGKRKKEQDTQKEYYDVVDFDEVSRQLTIQTEFLPPHGTLILSLTGEIAQIKRRMSARKAILEGRSVNPELGILIEEKGEITTPRPSHKIKALTAFVREKVFPTNPPTVVQEKAIEVALSTPDIALIQGPPGTGKTTVIAAIIERLNEMADNRGTQLKGKILLTGFQHDAVENMIGRLKLNGIPVPKFGTRPKDSSGAFEKKLEDWCVEIAERIRAEKPGIVEVEKEMEIKSLCLQYIKAPTRALALVCVKRIASLGAGILGESLWRHAVNLEEKLSLQEKLNAESHELLDSVRRLRTRPECFVDDGPERAADALDGLKDDLKEDERKLLDAASQWANESGLPPFLDDLTALKKKLLVHFTAPPVFRVEKQDNEVIALAKDAIPRIRIFGFSAKDARSAALAEFLAEMENNPYGMIEAVSDYSFAFAATCQQSVNKRMQLLKGIRGDDGGTRIEYDYVIVDEAARVSPRDLMIPMAQGSRIILVGDHRQLPHLIDDEVARQMEEGETKMEESDWLKKSLFEYLFSERLKALEGKDHITRRVTLDTQYRMHPVLGDFISRNFYERFDSTEKFRSGREATDFVHNLPDTENKPAVWIDVPVNRGTHQRQGTSWTRPAEAEAIVRQLRHWRSSPEGEKRSYGVISFYKAQANLIKKQLGGIADDDAMLRIGTVDSFQGMEFDVVFLSMVRTIPYHWNPGDIERAVQARQLFGHLCLYNRLNVSMSRQKRLLVLVGDSHLLQNDLAAEFVPGLVDFYKLCHTEEGRVLPCR